MDEQIRRRERVVITGLGVIASNGIGKEAFGEAIKSGKSGIKRIVGIDVSKLSSKIAGQIVDFKPQDYIEKKELKRMERFSQLAVAATTMAMEDAGLISQNLDLERCGIVLGTGMGSFQRTEQECNLLFTKGPDRISPFYMATSIPNAAAAQISIITGFKGYLGTTLASCAAGIQSVGEAYFHIQRGIADLMIAGASEASISALCLGSFCNLNALSTCNDDPEGALKPFSMNRDGFVMSEGAGIVIIESLSHAIKRNAHIYGEILGFGGCGDAYHITSPSPDADGMRRAMAYAILDSSLTKDKIDYINAHGSGTRLNDALETLAIKKVFGERAYAIPISSTKSMTGHSLASAGAIELIGTLIGMNEQFIPPTINYEYKDPECDLDYVPNHARKSVIKTAMLNSFGFGGQNASLIVGQPTGV